MWEASWPFSIMSELQMAYVSSFSSCPNTSSRAPGLRARRWSSAMDNMPAGPAGGVEDRADDTGLR